jgi:hypothetical protein
VARRPALAILAGLLSAGAPALAVLVLARSSRPSVSRPRTAIGPVAPPPGHWDAASRASLSLLRRVTADEARRAQVALARCEDRTRGAAPRERNARYRHCVLRGMARAGASAFANSRMLSNLADSSRPSGRCRRLVRELAGGTGALGAQVRTLMHNWAATPWRELLASSRAIRGMARFAGRMAVGARWRGACRVRAAAPARTLLA